MKYDLGHCLADYGFNFLEKVHQPIFLTRRSGMLVKINEAGRKFLHVARLTQNELEKFIQTSVMSRFKSPRGAYRRLQFGNRYQLIARSFDGSDLVLIEIVR